MKKFIKNKIDDEVAFNVERNWFSIFGLPKIQTMAWNLKTRL